MTLEQTKHNLKARMGYEITTSKGFTWTAVPTGWLDTTSKLVWRYEDEPGEYTFDDAVSRFGESLPTKEEYEEAEKHGIREVLNLSGWRYWSASVYSLTRSFAWYFYSNYGYVYNLNRNTPNSVRCVGRNI